MSKKRKTREEKIIAELRHKLESGGSEKSVKFQPQVELPKPSFSISSSINNDYSYVKKDLSKTIFLTTVAIFAFIVLYWWMNLGGVRILMK